MKKDYQKAFKKSTLFFLSNSVSFNGQYYEKQEGTGTIDSLGCSLGYKTNFRGVAKVPQV